MHPEQAALLRAISEEPDDDGVRLVYADWLDEYGQFARAEFIRAQVHAAALPISDPSRDLLVRRAETLYRDHEAEWRAERPAIPGVLWGGFSRGFIDHLTLDEASLLVHAPELFHAGPVATFEIQRVRPDAIKQVRNCAYLARVRRLIPPLTAAENDLAEMLRSPHFAGLEELRLPFANVGNFIVAVVARAEHFGRLRRLDLAGNRITFVGAWEIAESKTLTGLRSLSIFRNPLGDDGVIHLAQSPHLPHLRELDLQRTQMGTPAVRALAKSAVWHGGDVLNLCYNTIDDAGAVALAECPLLATHRTLVLRSNKIGDAGAEAIAASPHLTNVQSLELGSNEIGPRGRRALFARFGDRVHV